MSQDKDELARRLAAMTGEPVAPDDGQHPSDALPDHVDLAAAPTPAPPPAAPAAPSAGGVRMVFPDAGGAPPRATPQPRPFLRPAPPPPSMPQPIPPPRPGGPNQVYYTPPSPTRPAVTQPPMVTPVDDDAVIVPAPDQAVFAPRPAARRPVRRHVMQTLGFKRTIIPILLTLGLLCPVLGLLGFFVASTSPLSVLRSAWFSGPFILIGLLNLAFAIVTMLQVRHELERQRREPHG